MPPLDELINREQQHITRGCLDYGAVIARSDEHLPERAGKARQVARAAGDVAEKIGLTHGGLLEPP
ncbi:MAG: hypothetical protein Kow0022_18550 [Phycisphaerales bacterium]